MLSTNIGVKHFDPEAYVNSGIDYMTISIDGATQSVYEKFRKKGDLETVFKNVRSLIQTKKRLGKRTPMISWQYLAFEHNEHEIDDAIKLGQEFGVDQLIVGAPFDVSADDANVRPSRQVGRVVVFNPEAGEGMLENWNPFPSDLQAEAIEREFDSSWRKRLPKGAEPAPDAAAASRHTCQYLYKNIVMDGRGRIVPCCAAPQHGMDLVFGNAESGSDVFNSDKYQLARQSFANPTRYRSELDSAGLLQGPFCDKCTWDQDKAQIDKDHVVNYFNAVGHGVFNPASLALLGSW
jgi:MoaA/NifB/PqqE/SkfB family radical SAM enzyme